MDCDSLIKQEFITAITNRATMMVKVAAEARVAGSSRFSLGKKKEINF